MDSPPVNFTANVAFPVLIGLLALLFIILLATSIMVTQAHRSDLVRTTTDLQYAELVKGDRGFAGRSQVDFNALRKSDMQRGNSIFAPFGVVVVALLGYIIAYSIAMSLKPQPAQLDLNSPNVALYCWGFGISVGAILTFMLIGTLKSSSCRVINRIKVDCVNENIKDRNARYGLASFSLVIALAILAVSIAGVVIMAPQSETAAA